MIKENSTLSKRLKQYSALAAPMLAVAGAANAQVMYTDVNPDVVLNVNASGDTYGLDLNNDGTTDFVMIALGSVGSGVVGPIPYPYTTGNLNALAGDVATFGTNFIGYPSALAQNDNIDNTLNFFKLVDIVNGNNQFFIPAMFSAFGGASYGHWQGGVTDGYLGLQFSPDGSTTYYGWARCDVSADGGTLTIKDYAYNSVADAPLFAGQGNPSGIITPAQSKNFNIFGYEGVANIFVNDGNIDGATVTVTNMIGQTLVKQAISNRDTRIDLNNYGKGIYMVTVNRGDEVYSKKVSFR